MKIEEIKGMLNMLGVEKDERRNAGKPITDLILPIAALYIAIQLWEIDYRLAEIDSSIELRG